LPPQQPAAPQHPPGFAVGPTRPRRANNNAANIVLTVLGCVFLVLLLSCGGIVYGLYSLGRSAQAKVLEINRQIQREQQEMVAKQEREAKEFAERVRRDQEQAMRESRNRLPQPTPGVNPTPFPPVTPSLPPEDPEAKLSPFDKHLRWLQSRDDRKVADAADWFAKQPLDEKRRSEVASALVANLSSSFSRQADKLMAALEVWGSADAADALAKVAQFQPQHAEAAAKLLAKYDDAKAASALVAMLRQGPNPAKAALKALAAKGDAAKTQLIPLINDPDANLRGEVRKALAEMKVEDDDLAAQAIADAADASSNQKRAAAVEWLGQASLSEEKRKLATQAIAGQLKDKDFFVRSAALKALLADKSKESSDALLPYVEDRQAPWNEVLGALMARGDTRVAEPLGKLVKEPLTMGQALQAIRTTNSDGEDVVWHYINHSKDAEVVTQVLFALGESGTQKSVAPLKKVLVIAQQTNNGGLKIAAEHALRKIAERGK
jgi:hypothetical protein